MDRHNRLVPAIFATSLYSLSLQIWVLKQPSPPPPPAFAQEGVQGRFFLRFFRRKTCFEKFNAYRLKCRDCFLTFIGPLFRVFLKKVFQTWFLNLGFLLSGVGGVDVNDRCFFDPLKCLKSRVVNGTPPCRRYPTRSIFHEVSLSVTLMRNHLSLMLDPCGCSGPYRVHRAQPVAFFCAYGKAHSSVAFYFYLKIKILLVRSSFLG